MAIQPKPRTLEDFVAFALLPENADRSFEFIRGEVIEVSPNRTFNSEIIVLLIIAVNAYCQEHQIDVHMTGEGGAYSILGNSIAPDFALKRTFTTNEYPDPEPPLWAVEVISPTDKRGKIRQKRSVYSEAGILLWEIYPEDFTVEVYAPGKSAQIFEVNDILDGGDVLPGFTIPVRKLFPRQSVK